MNGENLLYKQTSLNCILSKVSALKKASEEIPITHWKLIGNLFIKTTTAHKGKKSFLLANHQKRILLDHVRSI